MDVAFYRACNKEHHILQTMFSRVGYLGLSHVLECVWLFAPMFLCCAFTPFSFITSCFWEKERQINWNCIASFNMKFFFWIIICLPTKCDHVTPINSSFFSLLINSIYSKRNKMELRTFPPRCGISKHVELLRQGWGLFNSNNESLMICKYIFIVVYWLPTIKNSKMIKIPMGVHKDVGTTLKKFKHGANVIFSFIWSNLERSLPH